MPDDDADRPAVAPEPVPMLLLCPMCTRRHVDRGSFASRPHHTHACQYCGHVWRPAAVPTVGVRFLPGFKDTPGFAPDIDGEPSLYWVTTEEGDEDWFVVATHGAVAEDFFEGYEGYDPGDATADFIADLPEGLEVATGWPSDEVLLACGGKRVGTVSTEDPALSALMGCVEDVWQFEDRVYRPGNMADNVIARMRASGELDAPPVEDASNDPADELCGHADTMVLATETGSSFRWCWCKDCGAIQSVAGDGGSPWRTPKRQLPGPGDDDGRPMPPGARHEH